MKEHLKVPIKLNGGVSDFGVKRIVVPVHTL